jgi:transposase
MQVVYERCCGLNVHKDTVAACIAFTEGARVHGHKRVFGTRTTELLQLSDWLAEYTVSQGGAGVDRSVLEADLKASGRAV